MTSRHAVRPISIPNTGAMAGHAAQGFAETQRESIFYKPQGREVALFEYAFHSRLPVMIKWMKPSTR
jgi:nitric oxide reductase NorQ protein